MSLLSSLAVSGVAITVFVAALLLAKRNMRLTDQLLLGWLTALGANQVFFLWSSFDDVHMPFWVGLTGMGMVLIHAPLMFLFVKYAFKSRMHLLELLHLLPFILFMLMYGLHKIISPDSFFIQDGFLMFTNDTPRFIRLYGLYFALVGGGYTFLSLYKIREKRVEIDRFCSNQTRDVLQWLQKWIIAAMLFFLATFIFIEFALSAQRMDSGLIFPIVSGFITLYIFYIGFLGIRYTRVFQEEIPDLPEIDRTENSKSDEDLHIIAAELKYQMEKEKLFLNPDLTLPELAQACNQTTAKVSMALNKVIGKNFYTFVNEYRVEAFIKQVSQPESKHLSLLGLAFECGFRSKSTFNEFFKSHTGMTPSRYRRGMGSNCNTLKN